MGEQLSYLPPEPVKFPVELRTYIYYRPDGTLVHVNCGGGFIGDEYEHKDDPNWEPPSDWPYEIRDLRKEVKHGAIDEGNQGEVQAGR